MVLEQLPKFGQGGLQSQSYRQNRGGSGGKPGGRRDAAGLLAAGHRKRTDAGARGFRSGGAVGRVFAAKLSDAADADQRYRFAEYEPETRICGRDAAKRGFGAVGRVSVAKLSDAADASQRYRFAEYEPKARRCGKYAAKRGSCGEQAI